MKKNDKSSEYKDEKKLNQDFEDCVVFMSAYKTSTTKKILPPFKQSSSITKLLNEYHLLNIMSDNILITRNGKLNVDLNFNSNTNKTEFEFSIVKKNDKIEKYSEDIEQVGWCLSLHHSLNLLLDPFYFSIPFFISMESFLVTFSKKQLQVNPIVFFLNGILIICFELINFKTGKPLSKKDIYGRSNNYNIKLTDEIQFFDCGEIIEQHIKIPDIIFENISSFFEKFLKGKFIFDQMSYMHNLIVYSNSISNIERYFQKIINQDSLSIRLNNINSNNSYKYYSREYLGVATAIKKDNENQIVWDVQLLEAFKMYILLQQITNYDFENDLQRTMINQTYIDQLLVSSRVPIITINSIQNLRLTVSFQRYSESINLKISYLNLLQNKRKNLNGLLLNILLYFLTFLGTISTLQVIKDEYGIQFTNLFIPISLFFITFGIVWFFLELKR